MHVVVVLSFDQNCIEVQDRCVRVADLEILIDRTRDLPFVRKRFSLCRFFFNKDSSLEVSVDDVLVATLHF